MCVCVCVGGWKNSLGAVCIFVTTALVTVNRQGVGWRHLGVVVDCDSVGRDWKNGLTEWEELLRIWSCQQPNSPFHPSSTEIGTLFFFFQKNFCDLSLKKLGKTSLSLLLVASQHCLTPELAVILRSFHCFLRLNVSLSNKNTVIKLSSERCFLIWGDRWQKPLTCSTNSAPHKTHTALYTCSNCNNVIEQTLLFMKEFQKFKIWCSVYPSWTVLCVLGQKFVFCLFSDFLHPLESDAHQRHLQYESLDDVRSLASLRVINGQKNYLKYYSKKHIQEKINTFILRIHLRMRRTCYMYM